MEAIFNRWSRARISDSELKRLIQMAMVPNKETYELMKTGKESELSSQFDNTVSAVLDYSLTSPSQQEATTKGTLFGFYNSVSDYYQNVKGYRITRLSSNLLWVVQVYSVTKPLLNCATTSLSTAAVSLINVNEAAIVLIHKKLDLRNLFGLN